MPSGPDARRNDAVAARGVSIAAGVALAAFVVANGIPTLRHDWNWPIDRLAISSFLNEATMGWLSVGFGVANPHPTTYLIAAPLAAVMWLAGPLAALGLLAAATGYCCARGAFELAARWDAALPASVGVALFAIFNPWVYNQVVAGHLVMVLAYGGLLNLLAEMMRGGAASPVRLALWLVLIEVQLQFFIVAAGALLVFAVVTKKWLPVIAGAVVVLPSAIGLVAERGALLQIPYSVEWQTNQSVGPLPLLSLGGYFAGYADRLGLAAQAAVWTIVGLSLAGSIVARRRRAALWAVAAAGAVYLVTLGIRGPLAVPYAWVVRQFPESGVFRELYDLAGILAALLALLACAAAGRAKALGYVALVAGIVLPVTWLARPPGDLWVPSHAFPHAPVVAPPLSRVAFLPAFQPLQLRDGRGDGADPDVFVYPGGVAPLNEYFPTYPVDMALGRLVQRGETGALRALGVAEIVSRPWLLSRSDGAIGLAAASLGAPTRAATQPPRDLAAPAPLVSQCDALRIVAFADAFGACDVFFGDAPGYAPVQPIEGERDSIDPRSAWIDARLAFARDPDLAQGLGGALTQSTLPHRVLPQSWVLAYVRGRLNAANGPNLAAAGGGYSWIYIPRGSGAVVCVGLCVLAAESRSSPSIPPRQPEARVRVLSFERLAPFLYRVRGAGGGAQLLRLNERYDAGWVALDAWRPLRHVRLDLAVNGWLFPDAASRDVVLVQVTALLQLIAELAGAACVVLLLKALVREPTKRASWLQ